jgi:sirohydrochlorin cobaltochelatase
VSGPAADAHRRVRARRHLGQGGHLRADVPRLIESARSNHPGVAIELAGAAGEDDGVIAALAAYAMR